MSKDDNTPKNPELLKGTTAPKQYDEHGKVLHAESIVAGRGYGPKPEGKTFADEVKQREETAKKQVEAQKAAQGKKAETAKPSYNYKQIIEEGKDRKPKMTAQEKMIQQRLASNNFKTAQQEEKIKNASKSPVVAEKKVESEQIKKSKEASVMAEKKAKSVQMQKGKEAQQQVQNSQKIPAQNQTNNPPAKAQTQEVTAKAAEKAPQKAEMKIPPQTPKPTQTQTQAPKPAKK